MAVPITRSTVISPNNAISSATAHTAQFQELFYQKKAWYVASGGTIVLSNGGGTASAADNIPNAGAVTMGAAGTGAWYVVEFAANTISNTVHRKLIYVDDASDPRQTIGVREGPGSWSGGSTSALPTLSGLATTAMTVTLHPFTTAVNLRWSSWRTTSPNRPCRFIVKQEAVTRVSYICEHVSNTGANGSGNERWASVFVGSSSLAVNRHTDWQSSSNWNAVDAGGSADTTTAGESALWRLSTFWTAGLDGSSIAHPDIIRIGQDVSNGRQLGTVVDTYALPALFPLGLTVDATEVTAVQDPLRVSFGAQAYYWPNGVTVE